ncbi:MAG: phosphatidylglycerophosphatase A family protein [bacterium]
MTTLVRPDLKNPVHFLAFGFGSGLFPVAPGTAGTLAAIPIYWLISDFSIWPYLGIVAAISIVGIWICGRSAADLNTHDHPGIVWDEIAGYLVTMTFAPAGWHWIVLGFVLFRLFDILKPWPISYLDKKVAGGLGIMLDDLLAGVAAAGVLWLMPLMGLPGFR